MTTDDLLTELQKAYEKDGNFASQLHLLEQKVHEIKGQRAKVTAQIKSLKCRLEYADRNEPPPKVEPNLPVERKEVPPNIQYLNKNWRRLSELQREALQIGPALHTNEVAEFARCHRNDVGKLAKANEIQRAPKPVGRRGNFYDAISVVKYIRRKYGDLNGNTNERQEW